jgi:peptidoglycan/xylan/chitin deacetylase (PgdA/CDA1 family)
MDDVCDDDNEIVLNEKAIVELDLQGCEIMSHTVSHADLTKSSNAELETELYESKRTLERILGHEVRAITYPYGACNEKVCEAAARAGYRIGFSVEPQTISKSTDYLRIGRFKVSPDESLIRFKLKVHGAYQIVGFLRRLKRTLAGKRNL